ncbi:MAG: acyl-CoA dehydrogenase family protein [Gordonibacter sp.]|uniref:acyl-CoA dehydrogenase family protein n=1 Tax=Gordonibacter sp. TaxID=1968902 RepID=UPI002FCB4EC0
MSKKNVLFNPATFTGEEYDAKSRQAMLDTVEFFEHKGLADIREDMKADKWQTDWMKYQRDHGIFATMLTAEGYGDDPSARFDLYRLCPMSEILGFYGQSYQYPLQVSILGVGPIWMGDNDFQKKDLAEQLKEGHVFAFGMSEKEHGADLYSNETCLTQLEDGTYRADGDKYYIGNAHIASKVSTMGKNATTGEYCNWVVDSRHPNYKYVKDIEVSGMGQCRVGEYQLIEYPISDNDILKSGDAAFADGLATVNIGKFQLGFSASGIATHALYEAVTHSNRRIIYGRPVTAFPHIRSFLSEAFCRTNAMKLYALRSRDYFRSMSADDRRYLLFNPIQKMKATTQGGDVIRMLMDVVCAKGYEADTYLSDAYNTMDMLFRLEGTAHVNMALVLKFLQNYLFTDVAYPEIGIVDEAKDDNNIFNQTMGGLAKVQFPDYRKAYEGVDLPNVKRFMQLIEEFRTLLATDAPDPALIKKDMDYMLNFGEIFTMIVYAQLVLEGAKLNDVEDELIDQMFALFVKDVNKYALTQVNNHINSEIQTKHLQSMALMGPVVNPEKDFKFWQEYVQSLDGCYAMNDSVIGID